MKINFTFNAINFIFQAVLIMDELMKKIITFLLLYVTFAAAESFTLNDSKILYLSGIDYNLTFTANDSVSKISNNPLTITLNGDIISTQRLNKGESLNYIANDISFKKSGNYQLHIGNYSTTIRVIPGWFSLLPPLAAIFLALIFRQVLIALFAGIWLGSIFIYGNNPFTGFLYALSEYIVKAPANPERSAILIFSLTLGGMVGVISKMGGAQGIVRSLSRYASDARRGQLATWAMGILIFFDDYANTLIVGNTMRPLTDKLRISREKLAYLVDATAAPVANIAIISTWIGYELSLINESFQTIGLHDNAYITFFKTIPYNFYPLFTLAFGFFIAWFNRDFFSMYTAESRAGRGDGLLRKDASPLSDFNNPELQMKENVKPRWFNGMIPIMSVILITLTGLWFTGLSAIRSGTTEHIGYIEYISLVIGNADSFSVLMWGAFSGSVIAIILAIRQKLLTLNEALDAWVGGVKSMVLAALILTLAWSIGNICTDLQTASYVVAKTKAILSPHLLPLLSFLIAGVIAFSTGTSWGTMAILMPIVIPLAYQLPALNADIDPALQSVIFLSSIASILAGATFGDHCSPISDTTILSSMASGADHIDHVKTQLPYAFIAAGVSIIFGYLPAGYGFYGWESLLAGTAAIILIVRFMGKKVDRSGKTNS
jgi:Na+/H+ antiporter NhaC